MPKTPEEIAAEEAEKAAAKKTIEQQQLADAQAEAEKWKALSRKNEERANSNADKAKRFDEMEDANRTELEREKARADAAEKIIADQKAKDDAAKVRDEVAKAKGFEERNVPASALRGSTREELEAHADEILALLPEPKPAPSADGQGNNGNDIGDGEMSADDIVEAATAR
jgi:membrane protein involved in colicin uptake